MFKRIVVAAVIAAAAFQIPTVASAAEVGSTTSSPNYTLCALLPWLPSCQFMFNNNK